MRLVLTYNLRRTAGERDAEFDTRETIDRLAALLGELGHTVVPLDVTGSIPRVCERLRRIAPELVFNLAEGERGAFREAFYPALFEQLGYPHTGSSASTLALCLDKALAERVVAAAGVAVPGGVVVRSPSEVTFDGPWFVKPNFEGASKGITPASLVRSRAGLGLAIAELVARYPDGVLVERYIDGLDVSVAWVAGIPPLPAIAYRYEATTRVYDYALKHVEQARVTPEIPARLDELTQKRLALESERVFAALGVTGLGRADFRVTPSGEIIFLEMNPLPSLGDGELFGAAAVVGQSPRDVVRAVVSAARVPIRSRARG